MLNFKESVIFLLAFRIRKSNTVWVRELLLIRKEVRFVWCFLFLALRGEKTWPFIRIVMLWGSGHAIQEGLLLLFTECLNLWSSFLGHDQTIGP